MRTRRPRRHSDQAKLMDIKLTKLELRVLRYIASRGEVDGDILAAELGIDPTSLADACERLKKYGFIRGAYEAGRSYH